MPSLFSVCFLFLVFFSNFCSSPLAFSKPILVDSLVASLGRGTLLQSDIDAYFRTKELREQLDPLFTQSPLGRKGDKASFSEVVSFLTDQQLILQAFPISDAEVEEVIRNLEKNNQVSRSQFVRQIEGQGFRFQDYFEFIRLFKARSVLLQQNVTLPAFTEEDIRQAFLEEQSAQGKTSFLFHVLLFSFSNKAQAENFLRTYSSSPLQQIEQASVDLGFLNLTDLTPSVAQAVSKMSPENWSTPLPHPSEKTYWVAYLKEIRNEAALLFDTQKEAIRNRLIEKETERQLSIWLARKKANWSLPQYPGSHNH